MSKFNSIIKNRWVLLGLAILLLSISYYIDRSQEANKSNFTKITKTLQSHLNTQEKNIEALLENDSLLIGTIKNGFNLESKEKIERKDLVLLAYKDTTLVFWSSNIFHSTGVPQSINSEIGALKTANGWYLYKKRKIGDYSFVALYNFYKLYQYSNRYLQSSFVKEVGIENTAELSAEPISGYTSVKSIYGKKLFYISLQPYTPTSLSIPILVLALLGFWVFFIFLSRQYEWFLDNKKPLIGTFFFAIILLGVKLLIVDLGFPSFLQSIQFFNPSVYASKDFSSLGALFVSVLLLFVFVFSLYKQNNSLSASNKQISKTQSAILFILLFVLLIVFTSFIIQTIKSLIIDSNIPFDVSNIFHFTWFSIIGLLITALLVSVHFFASSLVYTLMLRFRLDNNRFLLYGLISIALYALIQFIDVGIRTTLLIQAPAYAFALLLVLQLSKEFKTPQRTLAFVLVVSVFVALLFYRFNDEKEHAKRKHYAIQLGDSKDIEAESIFTDIEHQIANDPRIFSYFRNAVYSKRDLEKHIKQLYFSGYLGKYDVEIFDYDTLGNFYRENNYYTYDFVDNLYNNFAQQTLSSYFYYILYPSVQYSYIAKYDYCSDVRTMGSLYILLKRKLIQDQSLFTELLSQSGGDNNSPPYSYSYALYQNNRLVNKGGKYSYPLTLSIDTAGNKEFINVDGYNHFIKHEPNNITILVSKKSNGILQPLAVFSFLFLMLLLFIALIFVYNSFILLVRSIFWGYKERFKSLNVFGKLVNKILPVKGMRGLLFSTRIQVTMFALVSSILLLSGYIFLRYIDYKYTERQQERMVKKIKSVSSAFENQAQFEMKFMLPTELNAYLNQIGDFYETDINFYSPDGQLVSSTKNKIFASGLIARQINPIAYQKLKVKHQSFYLHEENIGELSYLSAYVPILDSRQNEIAYLNLPFFTNEAELNEEISAFFVNFVNLYILFFLVAALLAYFITQRVTAPLTLIQNKLSKLSLSSKNEVLEWNEEDEIGELVAQYNKMIIALEESAGLLAESEREGAWREMARQIAHEIKNPLTPMKLSIQHLQRAWAMKGDNIDETFKRVTNVLIEQIDSLSNLASEFSAFAKMPEPVEEKLELNNLLQSVAYLYEDTENLEVRFYKTGSEVKVFADKDQLSRVFKNIVTNAIQAIPEEVEGRISINIETENGSAKVLIKDNGKGIPSEQGNKVFIPSFSTKTSGMGLGLAISKKIIETFNGKIYFDSIEGEGTIFYIELPLFDENIC